MKDGVRRLRTRSLLSVLAAMTAAGLVAASAVGAATRPSEAPTVEVGVPFSAAGQSDEPDLWRLNATVRTGDRLQIAADNSQGSQRMRICLLAPVDDFGLDNEVEQACGEDQQAVVGEGDLDRVLPTYSRPTGQPLIRVASLFDRVTHYTLTVERIIPKVTLGTTLRRKVSRRFTYRVNARFGDNTPVTDGYAGVLRLRTAKQKRFTRVIARASSTGGRLDFQVRLPRSVRGKPVKLQACVVDSSAGENLACLVKAVRVRR